jgi:hypothetical protein
VHIKHEGWSHNICIKTALLFVLNDFLLLRIKIKTCFKSICYAYTIGIIGCRILIENKLIGFKASTIDGLNNTLNLHNYHVNQDKIEHLLKQN